MLELINSIPLWESEHMRNFVMHLAICSLGIFRSLLVRWPKIENILHFHQWCFLIIFVSTSHCIKYSIYLPLGQRCLYELCKMHALWNTGAPNRNNGGIELVGETLLALEEMRLLRYKSKLMQITMWWLCVLIDMIFIIEKFLHIGSNC